MKTTLLLLLLPMSCLAGSPFDGTWGADLSSANLSETDKYLISRGWYDCQSCVPPIHVKADGSDQPVGGYTSFDTVAVQIVNARVVTVTDKKAGKFIFSDTYTVSNDGKTMVDKGEDHSEAALVTTESLSARVAPMPPGAHALSGSWRLAKLTNYSKNASTFIIHATDTRISVHDLNGAGFDAQFDGRQYPMVGNTTNDVISVKRLNARSYQETITHDGKVVSIASVTVAPDGRTSAWKFRDIRDGTRYSYTFHKQ